MDWLKDTAQQWGKVAEATRSILDMPEANLNTSDPQSLLFDEDNETINPLEI